ncbi:hypothetical protein FHS15_001932 [Paenibacillus castaneae]|uniref:YdhK family protein n=1 Tax=Paenibacillus castaneae TaxID=474957 RepID=UPI000C9BD37D|nr:YdhK family protein [Paenibacillus castaneae]NIK76807.1 hypothetical protein [Paenibacillus castaneae]
MKKILTLIIFAAAISLVTCGYDVMSSENQLNHPHMGLSSHASSGEVPKTLKTADNPVFKVGSQAIIKDDHMKGMRGAVATIVGAYDTTVYSVSYTPTTGGNREENHEWIIQEEIKNASDKPYKAGTKVILEADHMKGMYGATAKIDSVQKITVYMVDYTPTTGGERIMNHKWVVESELSPVPAK